MLLAMTFVLAQAAPSGSVLAARGQYLVTGWDGTKRSAVKMGDSVQLLEEVTTEGDGVVKLKLSEGLVIVVGTSSKLVWDKYDAGAEPVWQLRLAYGRARIIADGSQVRAGTEHVVAGWKQGEAVVIVEGGKTQVVALSGAISATPLSGKAVAINGGSAVDFAARTPTSPYGIKDKTVRDLRVSLDVDETPLTDIAQALETDLPGFIGPKVSRVRWRGVSEGYGEGGRLAQPFNQTAGAALPVGGPTSTR